MANGKGSRPDLVLVNRKEKKIAILEFICPLEHNITKASTCKTTTYTPIQLCLEERGFKVELLPFETGSAGHITNHNKKGIEKTLKMFGIKLKTNILTNLSTISLLCTMSIFYAYQQAPNLPYSAGIGSPAAAIPIFESCVEVKAQQR